MNEEYSNPSAAKPVPPQWFLKEAFDYEPDTGILRWKVRPRHHFAKEMGMKQRNAQYAGKPAGGMFHKKRPDGTKTGASYHQVAFFYDGIMRRYQLHRVIAGWLGWDVDGKLIDHKDGDGLNNRQENLRLATYTENSRNCKGHSDRIKSLPKGVSEMRRKRDKTVYGYLAKIALGTFPTPELAHEAYCKAVKLLHGEFGNEG